MKPLLRIVTPWWLAVTGPTAEEAEPGTLTILQEKMAEACQAIPGERLLLWEDDALVAPLRAAPTIGFGGHRPEPASGGHWLAREMSRYFVGPEPAGESALGAVQAAVLVGEQLGMEPGGTGGVSAGIHRSGPGDGRERGGPAPGAGLSRRDDGDSVVDFGGEKCDHSVKTFSGWQS